MARLLFLALFVVNVLATLAMARPLGIADPPSPASVGSPGIAGGPESQQIADPTSDKSIAGAEVILGGFATAVLAIILCYIRVTRKNNGGDKA